ncbi:MAG: hypothetical protein J6J86_06715 [Lachnospiraceae bacterium]|nr:hypothetical protein [Lachnospiraceae bacterium]
MLIGICDDDERDRKQIIQICESVLESSTEKYEIREFETGRSVLEYQHKIKISNFPH